jgi:hypothetical protein
LRCHDLDPFLVVSSTEAPKHEQRFGIWWDGLTIENLLAEPEKSNSNWISCIAARLAVASTGPLLSGGDGPMAARLEAAGWFKVAYESDLNAAREAAWPTLNACRSAGIGSGSLAPKIVLVNERDPYDKIPFLTKSGAWIFRALRLLGHDELSIYVANAFSTQKRSNSEGLRKLYDTFAQYDPIWVGCGLASCEVLRGADIKHIGVVHPHKHMKQSFDEGIDGYAKHLWDAKVPVGPYCSIVEPNAHALPTCDDSPVLRERLCLSVGNSISRPQASRVNAPFNELEIEKARLAFVTGEVKDVAEAAKLIGLSRPVLQRYAKDQNWVAERAKHLETIREKAKATSSDAEAKAISKARQLAWVGALKAIANFTRSMDNQEVRVKAQDMKAATETAVMLKAMGDPSIDAEKARLGSLRPDEIAKELNETVKGMFGINPEEAK